MGQLKPGVKYIYERHDGTVYAREFGADSNTRVAVGWDWEPEDNPSRVRGASRESMLENQLWYQIRTKAKDNPALQAALDRAKMLYYLSKEDGQ
jgi:hypothetical protein